MKERNPSGELDASTYFIVGKLHGKDIVIAKNTLSDPSKRKDFAEFVASSNNKNVVRFEDIVKNPDRFKALINVVDIQNIQIGLKQRESAPPPGPKKPTNVEVVYTHKFKNAEVSTYNIVVLTLEDVSPFAHLVDNNGKMELLDVLSNAQLTALLPEELVSNIKIFRDKLDTLPSPPVKRTLKVVQTAKDGTIHDTGKEIVLDPMVFSGPPIDKLVKDGNNVELQNVLADPRLAKGLDERTRQEFLKLREHYGNLPAGITTQSNCLPQPGSSASNQLFLPGTNNNCLPDTNSQSTNTNQNLASVSQGQGLIALMLFGGLLALVALYIYKRYSATEKKPPSPEKLPQKHADRLKEKRAKNAFSFDSFLEFKDAGKNFDAAESSLKALIELQPSVEEKNLPTLLHETLLMLTDPLKKKNPDKHSKCRQNFNNVKTTADKLNILTSLLNDKEVKINKECRALVNERIDEIRETLRRPGLLPKKKNIVDLVQYSQKIDMEDVSLTLQPALKKQGKRIPPHETLVEFLDKLNELKQNNTTAKNVNSTLKDMIDSSPAYETVKEHAPNISETKLQHYQTFRTGMTELMSDLTKYNKEKAAHGR